MVAPKNRKLSILKFNSFNLIHTSDPLSDPPGGNFFIVSSSVGAALGRIKYKAKATTTQIPVNKIKLVSSLFEANGPSNLCTIKIKLYTNYDLVTLDHKYY